MPEDRLDNVAALNERVTGLERSVSGIITSLDSLAKEIRDRQRFPWGAASFAVAVIAVLGGVVIFGFMAYINANRDAQNLIGQQLAAFIQNSVPRTELDERKAAFEANFARIDAAIALLNEHNVSRGEHEGQWQARLTADENLQRQIDDIRAQFGSAYSLSDALTELGGRISRLEQIRLQQSAQVQPVP